MMIFGKCLGAALGFMAAGPVGLLVGLLVGHFFDRGLGQAMRFDFAGEQKARQQQFFNTIFSVLGYLAKADGRVSEQEVALTEDIFRHLGLDVEQRKAAIARFKQGSTPDYQLEADIGPFLELTRSQPQARVMLLEFLIALALADGELHQEEMQVLRDVGHYCGLSEEKLEQLIQMVQAQQRFSEQGQDTTATGGSRLSAAYQALGVRESDSTADIRKAYRKLMSEHHPDKLAARGVPETMMKVATEKSQEIQAAWETIKKHRKNVDQAS